MPNRIRRQYRIRPPRRSRHPAAQKTALWIRGEFREWIATHFSRCFLGAPYEVPKGELTPAAAENTAGAFTCTSTGGGEGSGVMYDYSLTLDEDEEIVGATFGIMSTTASERELLTAADLYFYAVSLLKYDTADTDALTEWFAANLANASEDAIETTIGDATFQLYGTPGTMYWVDISKA